MCTEFGGILGRRNHPFAANALLRLVFVTTYYVGHSHLVAECPGAGYIGSGTLYGLRVEAAHRHFHIRLSGGKPHLADENIIDGEAFLSFGEFDGVGLV